MDPVTVPSNQFIHADISLQAPVGAEVNFQRALLISDEHDVYLHLSAYDLPYLKIESVDQVKEIPGNHPSTNASVAAYLGQSPTPPFLWLTAANRTKDTAGDPAEYYWDAINRLQSNLDFYHILYTGDQPSFVSRDEALATCMYIEKIAFSYTDKGGNPIAVYPTEKDLINHLQCGHPDNLTPNDTPDNFSLFISENQLGKFTRTQVYYPDSPTDPSTQYYTNKLSSAVVSKLCSGGNNLKAPGTLATNNITNLIGVHTVGGSSFISPGYTSPTFSQMLQASGGSNNLLFYAKTSTPNADITYGTGSSATNYVQVPYRYLDQTIALDWLKVDLVEKYMQMVVQVGKPPYTTDGFHLIGNIIEHTLEEGKELGILNPDFNKSNGEYVRVPLASEATDTQRQTRETPPITFLTQLANSINKVFIVGNVKQ